MAKPVTEKIGEQIKKNKTGRTDREDDRANAGLSLPGPQIHALPAPKKKPTGYIADPDKGIDYHWIPDKYKNVSQLVEIKNDADRLHELRQARNMAATEARNYGNKTRGVERRRFQKKKLKRKKRVILTYKKISKNIIKTLRLTTKQRGFLLQNQ